MGTKLFVGNLSFDLSEEDLRSLFAEEGRKVKEVAIITDRETGRSRGFGFVTMETEDDAKKAMAALDGKTVGGRQIRVNEAQAQGDRRGGGGGGGGGGGERRGGRGGPGPRRDRY